MLGIVNSVIIQNVLLYILFAIISFKIITHDEKKQISVTTPKKLKVLQLFDFDKAVIISVITWVTTRIRTRI